MYDVILIGPSFLLKALRIFVDSSFDTSYLLRRFLRSFLRSFVEFFVSSQLRLFRSFVETLFVPSQAKKSFVRCEASSFARSESPSFVNTLRSSFVRYFETFHTRTTLTHSLIRTVAKHRAFSAASLNAFV